ncbi:cytochrome c oxidase subunit 3 [Actinomadura hallensis]|jgi:cytochrome c oxidase subunit 3|uniref:cytochrome-c oxidase n=1 Tax=Actinomadura hallensis TaxID=337895 RepID=A0A543IHT8_9ACTN|nr:cytochrome c oxidase subunit 3 [Actinomadura hallensis]
MSPVTASAIETTPHARTNRPNVTSVGTIVWLSSELMFFAALFAMLFTIRSVTIGQHGEDAWPGAHLDLPLSAFNTTILVLSSVTCQIGVFKAEAGKVGRDGGILNVARWGLREWYILTLIMGTYFVCGQGFEYYKLVTEQGLTFSSSAYGSVFYLTTGFHGIHVIGGLVAFVFILGRTYAAKRWTHEQATSAIVVSYYWHFVDIVWIGLFAAVYLLDL